jgi:hypothetical protein
MHQQRIKLMILQQVDPLLGNNLETNTETTSAARQQILNKQVYAAAAGKRLCKQACSHGNSLSNNRKAVFCWSMPRGYQWDKFNG